jgi:hypothetical protein
MYMRPLVNRNPAQRQATTARLRHGARRGRHLRHAFLPLPLGRGGRRADGVMIAGYSLVNQVGARTIPVLLRAFLSFPSMPSCS